MRSRGRTGSRPVNAEAGLAKRCKSGDLSAYERLYEDHGSRMKSIAYNMLGNLADAEDAVQEAFLKIYRKVGQFKGESAFTTWIYRVLINTCYDSMRKRQRRSVESGDSSSGNESPKFPATASRDHTLRLSLEKSLTQLPERKRTIFLLFEVEGLKHGEIAEILDIPEGTSKNLLFEARKAVQKSLLESYRDRSCYEL